VFVHAKDSDEVARHLLNHTDARDLEIVSRGLEDAFLSLTGSDNDDSGQEDDR
jgi:ABC-2 type transport system ATP-binding protein